MPPPGPSLTMLSQMALPAIATVSPSLKNAACLGPGELQVTRIFQRGQLCLDPEPLLPEYGGQICHGLFPEEFFQFLYPKTGVTGEHLLNV